MRFHAVYWPAMLLSAGEPLPTDIVVHDYLTVDGNKISKSTGTAVDPAELADRYGTDPVRWWLLREVPRVGDVDFTIDRLVARTNRDLADDLGNLVNRVVSMVHRYRGGRPPAGTADRGGGTGRLVAACENAPERIAESLESFDFRRATGAAWSIVDEANRYVEYARPWRLAKAERTGDTRAASELDAALHTLIRAFLVLAGQLGPFLPGTAARIAVQCTPVAGRLPVPRPLFPKIPAPVP